MAGTDFEIDPVKYGAMWQQVQDMASRQARMEIQVKEMGDQISELLALANRSKGGLWVAMAIVGGLTTIVVAAIDFLKGH